MDSSTIVLLETSNARNMENNTDIAFLFEYRYFFFPGKDREVIYKLKIGSSAAATCVSVALTGRVNE